MMARALDCCCTRSCRDRVIRWSPWRPPPSRAVIRDSSRLFFLPLSSFL